MTENIFGRWKKRFPILTNLRTHLELSQKIIIATAILHNIATLWNEELPEGEDPDDGEGGNENQDQDHDHDQVVSVTYELSDTQIKRIGQAERDKLLNEYIR